MLYMPNSHTSAFYFAKVRQENISNPVTRDWMANEFVLVMKKTAHLTHKNATSKDLGPFFSPRQGAMGTCRECMMLHNFSLDG